MPHPYVIVTSFYRALRHTPVYAACLRATVARLPRDMRQALRVVVVANDASRLERRALAWALKGLPTETLFVERETVYASWNRGVRHVPDAAACTFWNMDDLRFAAGMTEQFSLCAQGGAEPRLVLSPHIEFWSSRWPFGFGWRRRWPSRESLCPFFAANAAAFAKAGLFSEVFRVCGDTEWYARCLKSGVEPVFARRIAGVFTKSGRGLSAGLTPERLAEDLLVDQLHPGFRRGELDLLRELAARHAAHPPERGTAG
ncbi:MAG TPA: hypothetical protein P5137_03470 [Candidatus Brocadiia bacterium]|nr:hypothetical protein [Candidatus Brocadiia bacterium]